MPHEENITAVEGEISDAFAHRSVVRTADGALLADLGPEAA